MSEDKFFNAVITDGQIHHGENLRPWDGEEVQVTVRLSASEIERPKDFDVEQDVYVKMPVQTTVVTSAKIRDIGSATPSLILPEGIGDD